MVSGSWSGSVSRIIVSRALNKKAINSLVGVGDGASEVNFFLCAFGMLREKEKEKKRKS